MLNLELYVGKKVNIECHNGDIYKNYYVDCFTDAYDNYEPYEDSLDILKHKGDMGGRTIYRTEIKNIEIIEPLE